MWIPVSMCQAKYVNGSPEMQNYENQMQKHLHSQALTLYSGPVRHFGFKNKGSDGLSG